MIILYWTSLLPRNPTQRQPRQLLRPESEEELPGKMELTRVGESVLKVSESKEILKNSRKRKKRPKRVLSRPKLKL